MLLDGSGGLDCCPPAAGPRILSSMPVSSILIASRFLRCLGLGRFCTDMTPSDIRPSRDETNLGVHPLPPGVNM